MNRKFANPYIVFYPVISRDGMPFPVNRAIRILQGSNLKEDHAWRGNIVVAKYSGGETPFSSLIDASMADFVMLKNYFLTHGGPAKVRNILIGASRSDCFSGLISPKVSNEALCHNI